MILHTILQGGEDEFIEEEISFVITDGYRFGDKQFTSPNILWNNNKTFIVGDKSNVGFENQIQLLEYNHNTSEKYYTTVGTGAGYFDLYSHPVPYLWIENDYVYTGQSSPHNGPLSLWKSNVVNTAKNGFTQLTDISGVNAYPQVFTDIIGNVSICIRKYTPFDSLSFDVAVKVGNGSIEGTYTDVDITDVGTSGIRVYDGLARPYGINTKQYIGMSRRLDTSSPERYFAYMVAITEDFNTFYNPTNTASKNVVSTSGLTDAELDADYTINGSLADNTPSLANMNCISVNDVFYGIGRKASNNVITIWKIANDVVTEHTVDITDIYSNFFNPFLYWNGQNIVISCRTYDGVSYKKEIWAAPMDLSSFTQKYVVDVSGTGLIGGEASDKSILLPDNFDLVTGEYLMYLYTTATNAYFYKTTDKFYI